MTRNGNYAQILDKFKTSDDMNTILHLISMPWKYPYSPSIAIAGLKSYLEMRLGDDKGLKIYTYSAHLDIAVRSLDEEHVFFQTPQYDFTELPYYLILLKRFNPFSVKNPKQQHDDLIRRMSSMQSTCALSKTTAGIRKKLNLLEKNTITYIETKLIPRLEKGAINIVGLSVTFKQLYSSLFAYYYLHNKYGRRFNLLFLFGGGFVCIDKVLNNLRQCKPDAFAIIGEGELRLEKIIDVCLKARQMGDPIHAARRAISKLGDDYVYLGNGRRRRAPSPPARCSEQLSSLDILPFPDYGEYIEALHALYPDASKFRKIKKRVTLHLEGSRGCMGKCDFCGLNANWRHFRRKRPELIHDDVIALRGKYGFRRISFADNTCDSWVSSFSNIRRERMKRHQKYPRIYMWGEMRTDHDEDLWTRMALAGFQSVQLGIESMSDPLLEKMRKGTSTIANLQAWKYCLEMDIYVWANIIVYHPKTTLEDVLETERIMEYIPHFGKFTVVRFSLAEGSPIYCELSDDDRKRLLGDRNEWGMSDLQLKTYVHPYEFHLDKILSRATIEALDRFESKYSRPAKKKVYLEVRRGERKNRVIYDTRYGESYHHILEGDEVLVYDACHKGRTEEEIAELTKLNTVKVRRILDEMVKKRLMVDVRPHYLSIALRPREELIANI